MALTRQFVFFLLVFITCVVVGCSFDPAPTGSQKQAAFAISKQIRSTMTRPDLMQMPVGPTADTGQRFRQQAANARPLMHKLVRIGKAAEEPLWELLNDTDESVRRTTIVLLRPPLFGPDWISQNIVDLYIPLMERAISSSDPQIRLFACSYLGDCARYYDCLESLKHPFQKVAKLLNDSDKGVRAMAWLVSRMYHEELSRRAKDASVREAAMQEWERLGREESGWRDNK